MKDFFTTHDVAVMLNVTRVTVRNWIIKGKMAATSTPGGHRRISRDELLRYLEKKDIDKRIIEEYELTWQKKFEYCWEFHRRGLIGPGEGHQCEACLVFKSRAMRCHVLMEQASHQKLFCPQSCDSCRYFKKYFASEPTP